MVMRLYQIRGAVFNLIGTFSHNPSATYTILAANAVLTMSSIMSDSYSRSVGRMENKLQVSKGYSESTRASRSTHRRIKRRRKGAARHA